MTPVDLLNLMGLDFIERPNRLSLCCPFHHDTDPSSGFYLDTELFHCFACELTIDMTRFYAKYNEISWQAARQNLERTFGEIPRPKRIDRIKLLRHTTAAERLLVSYRERLGMQRFHHMGELLDKIKLAYQRDQIDESKLDLAMVGWYNRLEE